MRCWWPSASDCYGNCGGSGLAVASRAALAGAVRRFWRCRKGRAQPALPTSLARDAALLRADGKAAVAASNDDEIRIVQRQAGAERGELDGGRGAGAVDIERQRAGDVVVDD